MDHNIKKVIVMKELVINKLNIVHEKFEVEILQSLETVPWNLIDTVNWTEYSYLPKVRVPLLVEFCLTPKYKKV